jgi:hypothetical protein
MSIRLSLATVLVLPQVFGVACGSSTSESPTDGSAFADAGHLPKGGDATSETGPTCVPGSTCTSPDTCEDGGKASACGSHADRDAASGSDSASGHDAGGGPASDPFPRTFLRVIGDPLSAVSASNTLAGVPFSTLVAEYNAVDINPYLGTEGSIGDSWASVIKGWKSAATANGVALRAFLYSGGGAPDFAANSTYKWLPNAFSAANMWTYSTTTGPFGSSHTVGYSSGGGQIQSYWQISSDDIQTIPDATINGIATAPGLVGANVWQAYAQYYYDVFVNGLAASKYNESASYAANPDLDGIEYDNATPTARYVPVAGNWFGFTKAVSGYNASTTTAMMKGWANTTVGRSLGWTQTGSWLGVVEVGRIDTGSSGSLGGIEGTGGASARGRVRWRVSQWRTSRRSDAQAATASAWFRRALRAEGGKAPTLSATTKA